jgi:propanol-preferring alcohol dehydrogenase
VSRGFELSAEIGHICLHDGGEIHCLEQIHSVRKVNGTIAEFTVIPYAYLIRLPEGPSDRMPAPIMRRGVTSYKASKIWGATSGSGIVISGAGGELGSLGI